jgi:hypothetical protein
MMHRFRNFLFAVWFLAFCSAVGAATVRWTGAAQDVHGVWTITVAGTWATGDTATLTLNNKSVTVTVGSATTTANVADILARAVDAANSTEDLLGNETRNFGGEEIPEFAELDASASGSVLTITTEEPGVSLTAASGSVALTRGEVTAGDGALGAVTAVTAATGKNWLSNAANYSGGSVPVDNDTLIFDSGDVDALYALDHFRTNNIDLNIYISTDWTGQFGLPIINNLGYPEYRSRWFQFRGGSKRLEFIPGSIGNSNTGRCWVDLQDQGSVTILVTANRGSSLTAPSIFLAGTATGALSPLTQLRVDRGAVSVEPDDAPTASGKEFYCTEILVGTPTGSTDDALLIIGRNARLYLNCGLAVYSGNCITYAPTKSGSDVTTAILRGGTTTLRATGTYHEFDVYTGATLVPENGTSFEELELFGGTLDARKTAKGLTLNAELRVYAGSTILDPNGLIVDTFHAVGCTISQLTLELPANKEVDISQSAAP